MDYDKYITETMKIVAEGVKKINMENEEKLSLCERERDNEDCDEDCDEGCDEDTPVDEPEEEENI